MSKKLIQAGTGLVAILALSVVFAACGSDDDNGSSGGSAAGTESTAKGPELKVMLIAPVGGAADAFPEMADAAQAAADKINSEGGVGREGRELVFEVCDDKVDTNATNACARRAVQEGAAATIGNYLQADSSALDILEEGQVPSFANFPLTPVDFTHSNSYPIISGYGPTFLGIASVMDRIGVKKASVIAYAASPAAQLSASFFISGLESFGIEYNDPVDIDVGAPDVTAPVAKAASDGAEAVTFSAASTDVAKLLPSVEQIAPDLQPVTLASSVPASLSQSFGGSADGVLTVSSFPAGSSKLGGEYLEELEDYADDADSIRYNDQVLNVLSGVALFAQLVEDMDQIDGPAVTEALAKAGTLEDRAITYDPNAKPPIPALPRIRNVLQYEGVVEGGEIEPKGEKPFDPVNAQLQLDL